MTFIAMLFFTRASKASACIARPSAARASEARA
jgi:hypothetical protein